MRTPPEFFPQMSDAIAFQDRAQNALAAIPGVTGASAASALPLTATAFQATITIPGAPGNTGDTERDKVLTDMIAVRANYVEVMGMRLVAGRTFGESQQRGVAEAVIDTAFARRFFLGLDPLGAKIPVNGSEFTVVGIVHLHDLMKAGAV